MTQIGFRTADRGYGAHRRIEGRGLSLEVGVAYVRTCMCVRACVRACMRLCMRPPQRVVCSYIHTNVDALNQTLI